MRAATKVAAVVLVAAAGAVGIAAPAAAKGPSGVTIRAPGGEPVALPAVPPQGGGDDDRLLRLADDLGLWAAMDPAVDLPADPPSMPGPAFLVEWTMPGSHDGATIVQTLHPQAPGGPLVHTPPDQADLGLSASGGWYRASARLADTLSWLGWETKMAVPEEPAGPAWPADAAAAEVPGVAADGGKSADGRPAASERGIGAAPVAVGVGIAAAGAAVVGRRAVRRRVRGAAPARG